MNVLERHSLSVIFLISLRNKMPSLSRLCEGMAWKPSIYSYFSYRDSDFGESIFQVTISITESLITWDSRFAEAENDETLKFERLIYELRSSTKYQNIKSKKRKFV